LRALVTVARFPLILRQKLIVKSMEALLDDDQGLVACETAPEID